MSEPKTESRPEPKTEQTRRRIRTWLTSTAAEDDGLISAGNLLVALGVDVHRPSLERLVRGQPSFPSVTSVSDALGSIGVPLTAAKIERSVLPRVCPAVAHFDEGRFVLLAQCDSHGVTVIDPREGERVMGEEELGRRWAGVVLFARSGIDVSAIERQGWRQKLASDRRTRWLRRALAFCAVFFALLLAGPTLVSDPTLTVFSLGTLAGLLLSAALVAMALGTSTRLGEQLCPTDDPEAGCRKVLSSSAGRLPLLDRMGLGMADLGVVYFSAQALVLALNPGAEGRWALAAVAAMALPVCVFSIASQAFVIRAWCKLCLGVQLVLVAQAGLTASSLLGSFGSFHSVATYGLAFSVAAFCWLRISGLLERALVLDEALVRLDRHTQDPVVVQALLEAAPNVDFGELPGDVVVGPKDAPIEIGLVTRLGCPACESTHDRIQELMTAGRGQVRVRMRFAARPDATRLAQNLAIVDAALRGEHEGAFSLMDSTRAGAWTQPEAPTDALEALDAHAGWAETQAFEGTPTLVVAGKRVPADLGIGGAISLLRAAA